MAQVVNTQLKVSLLDKVSGPMKKVLASNKKFAEQVKKTAKVLDKSNASMHLIRDLKKQNAAFKKAREEFRRSQEAARSFARRMRETGDASAKSARQYERLRASVSKAARAMQLQKEKLISTKGALESAGLKVGNLARHERKLAEQISRTNRVWQRQKEIAAQMSHARERMHAGISKHGGRVAGGMAAMYTGARVIRALGGPVRQATDFSGAFAEVVKKANFKSEKEKREYKKWILNKSSNSSLDARGWATISANAYEAGIQDTEKNKKFTEMTVKGALAWDVSPDEAGQRLARTYNSFGGNLEELQLHMDRVNHLSNHLALSAGELLNYYSRTHAELEAGGFKSNDIAALGSFMIAADFQPEVAATTARNIMKPLVAGKSATKSQRKGFRALGLNPVAVAKQMQTDAWGTFTKVVERLNKLKKWQKPAVIKQLFGSEARAIWSFLGTVKDKKTGKMVPAINYLKKAHSMVDDPSKYRGSAEQEYQTRMQAADMQFRKFYNALNNLSIEIGNSLLPALVKAVNTIKPWIASITKLVQEHPKATAAVTGLVVASGAAIAALGALSVAIGAIGIAATIARFGARSTGLGWLGGMVWRKARKGTMPKSGGFAGWSAAQRAKDKPGLFRRAARGLGRVGKFSLKKLVTPLVWGADLIPRIPWTRLAGKLGWSALIKPFTWAAGLIPRIPWLSLVGRLSWSALIRPLSWVALRAIPVIGWAALAGELAWDLLIKPLGWDKYIWQGLDAAWNFVKQKTSAAWEAAKQGLGKIDWVNIAMFGLPGVVAEIVKAFTGIDLTAAGRKILSSLWDGMKSVAASLLNWAKSIASKIAGIFTGSAVTSGHAARGASMPLSGRGAAIAAARSAGQKKAGGGFMRPGLPTLVGERGPELIYPSRAGWVAHNDNVKRLARIAAAASVAGAIYYAPPAPATAAPTQPAAGGAAPVMQRTVHVMVQPGAIQIHAVGMSADQISSELGRRLGDTLRATMADVEDAG